MVDVSGEGGLEILILTGHIDGRKNRVINSKWMILQGFREIGKKTKIIQGTARCGGLYSLRPKGKAPKEEEYL